MISEVEGGLEEEQQGEEGEEEEEEEDLKGSDREAEVLLREDSEIDRGVLLRDTGRQLEVESEGGRSGREGQLQEGIEVGNEVSSLSSFLQAPSFFFLSSY